METTTTIENGLFVRLNPLWAAPFRSFAPVGVRSPQLCSGYGSATSNFSAEAPAAFTSGSLPSGYQPVSHAAIQLYAAGGGTTSSSSALISRQVLTIAVLYLVLLAVVMTAQGPCLLTRWGMHDTGVADEGSGPEMLREATVSRTPNRLVLTEMHMFKSAGFMTVEELQEKTSLSAAMVRKIPCSVPT